MRTAFGAFITFIIGVIVGAGGLWIAAHFTAIPGAKGNSSVVTTTTTPSNVPSNSNGQANTPNQSNQTTTTNGSLVAGFPTDAPVYQPATLLTSAKTTHGGQAVLYSANYTSTKPASDIITYYKTQLASNGWQLASQQQTGSTTVLHATNSNHQQADVLVTQLPTPSSGTSTDVQSTFQLSITPNSQSS